MQAVERANAALAEAEQAVQLARRQHALWTTAEDALQRARRADDSGDCADAMTHAQTARAYAELGIAQKSYPLIQ